jgi:hypothetical protein
VHLDTRHRVVMACMLLFLACGVAAHVTAGDKLRGPWAKPATQLSPSPTPDTSLPGLAARGALSVWHNVLSRADGPRSVMYPTASGFLGQAVAKHGLLMGMIMTTDRLMHEWDEPRRAPRVVKYGISRAYDPVEANDFWWAEVAE